MNDWLKITCGDPNRWKIRINLAQLTGEFLVNAIWFGSQDGGANFGSPLSTVTVVVEYDTACGGPSSRAFYWEGRWNVLNISFNVLNISFTSQYWWVGSGTLHCASVPVNQKNERIKRVHHHPKPSGHYFFRTSKLLLTSRFVKKRHVHPPEILRSTTGCRSHSMGVNLSKYLKLYYWNFR